MEKSSERQDEVYSSLPDSLGKVGCGCVARSRQLGNSTRAMLLFKSELCQVYCWISVHTWTITVIS